MALGHDWTRSPLRPGMGNTRRRLVESPNKPRLTLAQARKRRAITVHELAQTAGVAETTIWRTEQGKVPRYDTIRKLARALDMRPDEIDWPGDPLGLKEEG